MRRGRDAQGGFAIVSAVFLLVVLAALGVYMATIGGAQQLSTARSAGGVQAYFAARSGLEWAMQDIINAGAAGLDCSPGAVGFNLTGGALAGFSVTVGCSSQNVTEGSDNYDIYELQVTASRGAPGDLDFASRTLIATVTD